MHFADEAIIFVKAGDGGNGSFSFRREKYVARGGPDGGNGGDGGSIIMEANVNQNTLANFLGIKHYKAKAGYMGLGQNKFGVHGENKILKVPAGTLVFDNKTGELMADLTKHGQQVVLARGGMGGKGNTGFTTSVRQAPDFAELGEPGEEREIRMELKLIADVAIIGYPSVGKSTLISRISNAKPKIADYPFTTLVPNLGVVKVDDTDFVVADIPGLIEGAHAGKGLGDEFLKHIERTKVLVHVLDVNEENLRDEYKKLNKELELYSKELSKKPQLLVVNKTDSSISEIMDEIKKDFKKEKPLFISAVTGEGIDAFLYALKDFLLKHRKQAAKLPQKEERKVFRPHLDLPNIRDFEIEAVEGGFRVSGRRLEQMAVMTDMTKRGGILRMYDVWKKIGVQRQLEKNGAKEGDKIHIGVRKFEFQPS